MAAGEELAASSWFSRAMRTPFAAMLSSMRSLFPSKSVSSSSSISTVVVSRASLIFVSAKYPTSIGSGNSIWPPAGASSEESGAFERCVSVAFSSVTSLTHTLGSNKQRQVISM